MTERVQGWCPVCAASSEEAARSLLCTGSAGCLVVECGGTWPGAPESAMTPDIADEFAHSKYASTAARDMALLDEIERLRDQQRALHAVLRGLGTYLEATATLVEKLRALEAESVTRLRGERDVLASLLADALTPLEISQDIIDDDSHEPCTALVVRMKKALADLQAAKKAET